PPYGFDPSVPPPPFGCPPPGQFPSLAPAPPVITYSNTETFPSQFRAGPPPSHYDFQPAPNSLQTQHQEYEDFREDGASLGGPLLPLPPRPGLDYDRRTAAATQPEDEAALQRRQDIQWLRQFLQNRVKKSEIQQTKQKQQQSHPISVPALREALYGAAELISALEESCETLKHNVKNDCVWTDSYLTALNIKRQLQDKLKLFSDSECLNTFKAKLNRVSKRRVRKLRASKALQVEEQRRQELICEKEASIDKWRMKQIHEVEEKKKEQELKLAADAVLCEVRKKQADIKRMQDILRSLEKLRRLRKEAASRKGESSRLEQLRSVMKRRTVVYSAEEKALMVMLEGEQEEERRREQERRVKKERERHLQRKRRMDSMLFGDELPAGPVLQPFREYYTQAEHSLDALIQIRRDWDVFVVAPDHPDGSPVPQGWVLPVPPSDQDWAAALQPVDTDTD
uniref:Programmed cell death 7 n=1 Tax=Monopterus albus TaxID=43700 RepID=A0A3Q3IZG2_MONAL